MNTAAPTYAFDQSNTRWFPLGDFKHLELAMLAVDRPNKIVDFMVKLHAKGVIFATGIWPRRAFSSCRVNTASTN